MKPLLSSNIEKAVSDKIALCKMKLSLFEHSDVFEDIEKSVCALIREVEAG